MIINADARDLPIADKTVQCVVTSPPYYGLRDYGIDGQIGLEQTPEQYVSNLVSVFREVWRVLKDDGTLWVNLGDSYAGGGRGGNGDCITGRGKNASQLAHDVPEYLKTKDLIGIPWMVAFALRSDGWYLRSDIIWSKPNPMPESVTDRPTKAHEYLFLLTKSPRYYYDASAIQEAANYDGRHDEIMHGADKYNSECVPGNQVQNIARNGHERWKKNSDGLRVRNKRSVWTINTQPTGYAHFATYPEKLVEPCILAGSRPGDLILDPFSGSGTTGRVAIRHNRKFIGTELNFRYIADIAPIRLTVQPMLNV